MSEGELSQLIRDLIRLGVGLRVGADGTPPGLIVPDGKDEASRRARRAVRDALGTIRANRDEVVRLWPEVALEGPGPDVCGRCRAAVFRPDEAGDHPWAFCESLLCPYRTDRRSGDAKWWARRKEADRADDSPIPE